MSLVELSVDGGLPSVVLSRIEKRDGNTVVLTLTVVDTNKTSLQRLAGRQVYPFALVRCRRNNEIREIVLRKVVFLPDQASVEASPTTNDDVGFLLDCQKSPDCEIEHVRLIWPHYTQLQRYSKRRPDLGTKYFSAQRHRNRWSAAMDRFKRFAPANAEDADRKLFKHINVPGEAEERPWETEITREQVEGFLLKHDDHRDMLSPPVVSEPVLACAFAINLISVVPRLLVEVRLGGSLLTSVYAESPGLHGFGVLLPQRLRAGEEITVRQSSVTATSPWTDPIIVRRAANIYAPHPPPLPRIVGSHLYNCGERTCVADVPVGAEIKLIVDGSTVATNICTSSEIFCLRHRALDTGETVHAVYTLCPEDPSMESEEVPVVDGPSPPLPAPTIDPLISGQKEALIQDLTRGATCTLTQGSDSLMFQTGHSRYLAALPHPAVEGETITVSQRLCDGSPPGHDGSIVPSGCSELSAPTVYPPALGDNVLHLCQHLPEARTEVYIVSNGRMIGNSAGSVIELDEALGPNHWLIIRQVLGNCVSPGTLVRVVVTAPEPIPPLCGTSYYRTGSKTYYYPASSSRIGRHLTGVYWYPIPPISTEQPLDNVPCVIFQHGNHSIYRDDNSGKVVIPSYEGYQYIQQSLARIGIASVSVDVNFGDLVSSLTYDNIIERASLVKAHRTLVSTNSDGFFAQHDRFGLFGHSRGGDAVVFLEGRETNGDPVFALAPTDFTKFDETESRPPIKKAGLMVLLPAADGDVKDLDGARFYDTTRAPPENYPKTQLYVDWTLHNFFNTEWTESDWENEKEYGEPYFKKDELLPPAIHRAVLCEYTLAFFASEFNIRIRPGLNTRRVLTGQAIPRHLPYQYLQFCFDTNLRLVVDDFEQPNGVGKSTLEAHTFSSSLGAAEKEMREIPYVGDSNGLEVSKGDDSSLGIFCWKLDDARDLRDSEVRVRVAEVADGATFATNTPMRAEIGLCDRMSANGEPTCTEWIDMNAVSPYGIRRPFERFDVTKTVFETFCVNTDWFQDGSVNLSEVFAVSIRLDHAVNGNRTLAVDDVQIRIPIEKMRPWNPLTLIIDTIRRLLPLGWPLPPFFREA